MNVYTGGTFDCFHHGHASFLSKCRKIAGDNGKVIVALNKDDFIEKFKGKKPVMSYYEREQVLLSCKYVDKVVENIGGEDSKKTIEKCGEKIDMVVIGSDWHSKDYLKQMQFTWDWLGLMNIGLCYVQYTPKISTTEIKRRFE